MTQKLNNIRFQLLRHCNLIELVLYGWALGTRSKLNLHQTFREYPVRSIYVQVTSYVQGILKNENPAMILHLLVIL